MRKQRTRRYGLALLAVFTISMMASEGRLLAQSSGEALHLDASAPSPPVGPADYQGGASRAPNGSTIGVTDRYLTMNGKPWLPVMGELHYSRVPESEWEPDILRMKSAGVNIISTYVIWIHHEEVEGQWDWAGQKNLRHFAELCQKHGMLLYPRIGPWAHGEVRNGGLLDWVMAGGPVRQLDPKFMAETKTLYDQAGEQLRGLFWKDGGPVIGVQVENEYAGRAGQARVRSTYSRSSRWPLPAALTCRSTPSLPGTTRSSRRTSFCPSTAAIPMHPGVPRAPNYLRRRCTPFASAAA